MTMSRILITTTEYKFQYSGKINEKNWQNFLFITKEEMRAHTLKVCIFSHMAKIFVNISIYVNKCVMSIELLFSTSVSDLIVLILQKQID